MAAANHNKESMGEWTLSVSGLVRCKFFATSPNRAVNRSLSRKEKAKIFGRKNFVFAICPKKREKKKKKKNS
jgi:hypothetical protein